MLKIFQLNNEWYGRVYINSTINNSDIYVIEVGIENDNREYYFKDFVSSSIAYWEFGEIVKLVPLVGLIA